MDPLCIQKTLMRESVYDLCSFYIVNSLISFKKNILNAVHFHKKDIFNNKDCFHPVLTLLILLL